MPIEIKRKGGRRKFRQVSFGSTAVDLTQYSNKSLLSNRLRGASLSELHAGTGFQTVPMSVLVSLGLQYADGILPLLHQPILGESS
jgi:hypothetical protein